MKVNIKAIVEAIKEIARLAVLAAVSAVLYYGATQLGNLPADNLYALVGAGVLRALDKYVHENENIRAKGLVPF